MVEDVRTVVVVELVRGLVVVVRMVERVVELVLLDVVPAGGVPGRH